MNNINKKGNLYFELYLARRHFVLNRYDIHLKDGKRKRVDLNHTGAANEVTSPRIPLKLNLKCASKNLKAERAKELLYIKRYVSFRRSK
jgi:hypothetical protein